MHATYLQLAIQLACDNVENGEGGPYGAVIVKNNEIIAAIANKVTSTKDPTAHAEIMAIRTACRTLDDYQLKNCILYTSCEPCPMCLGCYILGTNSKGLLRLQPSRCKNAGFDDSFIYDELNLPPEQRSISMLNIPLEDAHQPFTAWNVKANKLLY